MEIEYIHKKKKDKKFYLKWGLFITFIGIFSLIVYTSFYGDIGFTTGSVISGDASSGSSVQKSLNLNAKLTAPSLDLSGFFQTIEISGGGDSFLEVGDQKFYLGNSNSNYITISNYDGQVSFDGKILSKLKGKASEIVINGVSTSSQSKETSKINLQSSLDYKYIDVGNNAQIKKVSYNASGYVNLDGGRNEIKINNEIVTISGFSGNIQSSDGKITFSGKIQGLEISGKTNVKVGI